MVDRLMTNIMLVAAGLAVLVLIAACAEPMGSSKEDAGSVIFHKSDTPFAKKPAAHVEFCREMKAKGKEHALCRPPQNEK